MPFLASPIDLKVGCTILVPFVTHCCYPPYKDECKALGYPGFAIDELAYLLDSLEFKLGRRINVHVSETASIAMDALINGDLDLIHPLLPLSLEAMETVDFVMPILNVEHPGFHVHMLYMPFNVTVFQSMQPLLWVVWTIFLVTVSFALTIFVKKLLGSLQFLLCWLQKAYDLLFSKRSFSRKRHSIAEKLLVTTWSLLIIYSLAMFKCKFYRNLTPNARRPFHTVKELAKLLENSDYFLAIRPRSPEGRSLLFGTDKIWKPLRTVIRADKTKLLVLDDEAGIAEAARFVRVHPGAIHPLGKSLG